MRVTKRPRFTQPASVDNPPAEASAEDLDIVGNEGENTEPVQNKPTPSSPIKLVLKLQSRENRNSVNEAGPSDLVTDTALEGDNNTENGAVEAVEDLAITTASSISYTVTEASPEATITDPVSETIASNVGNTDANQSPLLLHSFPVSQAAEQCIFYCDNTNFKPLFFFNYAFDLMRNDDIRSLIEAFRLPPDASVSNQRCNLGKRFIKFFKTRDFKSFNDALELMLNCIGSRYALSLMFSPVKNVLDGQIFLRRSQAINASMGPDYIPKYPNQVFGPVFLSAAGDYQSFFVDIPFVIPETVRPDQQLAISVEKTKRRFNTLSPYGSSINRLSRKDEDLLTILINDEFGYTRRVKICKRSNSKFLVYYNIGSPPGNRNTHTFTLFSNDYSSFEYDFAISIVAIGNNTSATQAISSTPISQNNPVTAAPPLNTTPPVPDLSNNPAPPASNNNTPTPTVATVNNPPASMAAPRPDLPSNWNTQGLGSQLLKQSFTVPRRPFILLPYSSLFFVTHPICMNIFDRFNGDMVRSIFQFLNLPAEKTVTKGRIKLGNHFIALLKAGRYQDLNDVIRHIQTITTPLKSLPHRLVFFEHILDGRVFLQRSQSIDIVVRRHYRLKYQNIVFGPVYLSAAAGYDNFYVQIPFTLPQSVRANQHLVLVVEETLSNIPRGDENRVIRPSVNYGIRGIDPEVFNQHIISIDHQLCSRTWNFRKIDYCSLANLDRRSQFNLRDGNEHILSLASSGCYKSLSDLAIYIVALDTDPLDSYLYSILNQSAPLPVPSNRTNPPFTLLNYPAAPIATPNAITNPLPAPVPLAVTSPFSFGFKSIELYPLTPSKEALLSALKLPEDDDISFADDRLLVSFKCPIAMTRITRPVRPEQCKHVQCFDYSCFIQYALALLERNGRWATLKCPVCSTPMPQGERLIEDCLMAEGLASFGASVDRAYLKVETGTFEPVTDNTETTLIEDEDEGSDGENGLRECVKLLEPVDLSQIEDVPKKTFTYIDLCDDSSDSRPVERIIVIE